MSRLHALLVDDDAQVLETMGLILEMDDYRVSTAPDGAQALVRLERGEREGPEIDFLVLDLDMPNLSGVELLSEIRKRGNEMPVMVVTGYATKGTVVELMRIGVTEFLDKPVHLEEFRKRVNRLADEALRRRSARRGDRESAGSEPRVRPASVVDLAGLGLPYAVRRRFATGAESRLILAARKPGGVDILIADVEGADAESFYVSVLVKSCFDRWRRENVGGGAFMASLNSAVLGGCLERKDVRALLLRVDAARKRVETYPAGYPCWSFLGFGGRFPKSSSLQGTALGAGSRPGRSVVEWHYAPGDRLFVVPEPGDGSDADGMRSHALEAIEGLRGDNLDALADGIWKEMGRIAPAAPTRAGDFLLGLELP